MAVNENIRQIERDSMKYRLHQDGLWALRCTDGHAVYQLKTRMKTEQDAEAVMRRVKSAGFIDRTHWVFVGNIR